jgi:hypothetical protein
MDKSKFPPLAIVLRKQIDQSAFRIAMMSRFTIVPTTGVFAILPMRLEES